jgi:hypothetical protein
LEIAERVEITVAVPRQRLGLNIVHGAGV